MLHRATLEVTEADLQAMVIDEGNLPGDLMGMGFKVARDGPLDNEAMAKQGFPGGSASRFREAGRITGYLREFGSTTSEAIEDGQVVVAGVVVHLFDSPESVTNWIKDIFLKDFTDNVGNNIGENQTLISVENLEPSGFFEEAAGLLALQSVPAGEISSTVVDFRLGRILGVAFIAVGGQHQRLDMATELGIALERRIVQVALGSA